MPEARRRIHGLDEAPLEGEAGSCGGTSPIRSAAGLLIAIDSSVSADLMLRSVDTVSRIVWFTRDLRLVPSPFEGPR